MIFIHRHTHTHHYCDMSNIIYIIYLQLLSYVYLLLMICANMLILTDSNPSTSRFDQATARGDLDPSVRLLSGCGEYDELCMNVMNIAYVQSVIFNQVPIFYTSWQAGSWRMLLRYSFGRIVCWSSSVSCLPGMFAQTWTLLCSSRLCNCWWCWDFKWNMKCLRNYRW